MKIAIVTDSSYDGKLSDFKDLYKVPLMITSEDGKHQYPDDDTLDSNQFYKMLSEGVLKTSQSIPAAMLGMWDKLLKDYDQIIVAGLSKGLSGQFNTYRMLSETEEKYQGKVFVVDTNGVSVVLQREIERIALLISRNKTGFQILEEIKTYSQKFYGFIIPKNLDTLKRGGRITPAAAALAKMLKIIPVLKYDGMIDKAFTARTFKKAVNEAIDDIKKNIKNLKVVDFAYSRCEPENLELVETLIKKAGLKVGIKSELANVIAAHTGRNTFAIVGWKE